MVRFIWLAENPLRASHSRMRGNEPLEQWQMGIVEDRASGHAELVITLFAVEQLRSAVAPVRGSCSVGTQGQEASAAAPSSSRQRSSESNAEVMSRSVISETPDDKSKKEQLKRVPTRKLLASIKQDIRRSLACFCVTETKEKQVFRATRIRGFGSPKYAK